MRQSPILLLFILILAMQAFAQDALNASNGQRFNGTWIFDVKKSDRSYKDLYKGQILEISYKEPELKLVKTQTMRNQTKSATMILFTDNRGETNEPYPFGNLQVKSNTVWDKDRLIRTYTIKIYKAGTTQVIGGSTSKETWATSEDGETLTIIVESHTKTATDSPYGELKTDHKGKIKLVYTRKK